MLRRCGSTASPLQAQARHQARSHSKRQPCYTTQAEPTLAGFRQCPGSRHARTRMHGSNAHFRGLTTKASPFMLRDVTLYFVDTMA